MTNWKEYKLDDIAEIYNAKRVPLSAQVRSKRKGVYPYYGASGIVDYIDDYIFDGEYVLISEDGENLRSRNTPIAFKAKGKFWVNNHSHILKGKEKYLNDWIIYYFQNLDINPFITGAVQPKLNKENLLSIPIRMPDFYKVEQIAAILSSLDDKIELNNKINQELENLAQTLFKQWFIDFEFPYDFAQGKPNENGAPYRSSGGEMVDSELGMIPKGWTVSTIDDITDVVTKGTTPTTIGGKFTDSGINFIKVESLTEQGVFIKSKFAFIDEETNQLLKRSIIKEGDVLFSIAGTIGRVAVATKDILPANTNQAIAIIRPNKVDGNFLKLLMQSTIIQNDTKSNVVQAVQANLSLGVIKTTKFIKPSSEILAVFKSTLSDVFEKVNLVSEEVQELTNLRDALLPKLISGELELSELKN